MTSLPCCGQLLISASQMAKYTFLVLLMAAAAAVIVLQSPVKASRHHPFNFLLQPSDHEHAISFSDWHSRRGPGGLPSAVLHKRLGAFPYGFRILCIPTASQLFEKHEGRHQCAYNSSRGFRAVGVGYNLDEDVDTRRTELSALLADYDKVYKGESCLYNLQINALLGFDANRALNKAAKEVPPLDDFCCDVQAVFADIVHASGEFPVEDMESVVEKAALKEWRSAGKELERTDWCYSNSRNCDDSVHIVKKGCA